MVLLYVEISDVLGVRVYIVLSVFFLGNELWREVEE